MENNDRYYPLTHPQRGIWYSEKLYPGTSIGNVAATLRLRGNVDYKLLEKAINLFIYKNDAIRLRIGMVNNEPGQYVSKYKYHTFEFLDFSRQDISELYRWDKKQTEKPFNILDNDLFYFALIRIDEENGGFYVKLHHLISDAWSMGLVGNSIVEYYSTLKENGVAELSQKPSYLDFISIDEDYGHSAKFQADQSFWTEKFNSSFEMTALKTRKSGELDTKARRRTFVLPKKLTTRLGQYCHDTKLSEYTLFLAALSMYINRITGKQDIILGTTLLNRTNAKEKETFGMFVNAAVPLRIQVSGDMNLETFAGSISKEVLGVLRHQKYPYELLLKQFRENNRTSGNLFDIVLNYQNTKFKKVISEPFFTRWHFNGHQIESLIININDRDNDGRCIVDYDYLVNVFSTTEIEFIHQHIVNLLWHGLDNTDKPIAKLEMISEVEKKRILFDFNNTERDFPKEAVISQLFEEQVLRSPNRAAVLFRDRSLTYEELNQSSNRLARLLRSRGVGPDSVVAVMVERSFEMMIGIIGILKAGGAYLPIDPNYPKERIEFMLANSGAAALLSRPGYVQSVAYGGLFVDLGCEALREGSGENLSCVNRPGDLAYIIYTSGSTGNPKGVMIEHRSLVNRLHWMHGMYPINEQDTVLQKTTYTFDVSVWELIWALLVGSKLCLLEPGGEKDPETLVNTISNNHITTIHFVPSMLNVFLEYVEKTNNMDKLASLRQVFASGEALSLNQVNKFNRLLNAVNGTQLYNLYGPTEAAIDVTYFNCSPEVNLSTVPIGKPIDNIKLFILDRNKNLLPIGIPGELFISGIGVARGYINNEGLTNEKFIENPFCPGEKMYYTGDLARWYPQGDIEYLGRMDSQIKIRGFRVELGEIEKRLTEHEHIIDAVAVGRTSERGDHYLCAYIISDAELAPEEIKLHLSRQLPDYMIPAFYIRMEDFPRLPNGKINRKALPEADGSRELSASFEAPANDIESSMLKVWEECLKIKDISVNDNFFDLGGDSLTIIEVLTRVYNYNWGISAADFYNYRTIRLLSRKIAGSDVQTTSDEETEEKICLPLINRADNRKSLRSDRMQNVLLTGVTGFLGIHLLRDLLEKTDANIYCLVRGRDKAAAENKLMQCLRFNFKNRDYHNYLNKRFFVVNGDICSDCFSLSRSEYGVLAETIDTVIHSAALVKYYGDYHDFYDVNICGTKRIVDFCRQNRVKLFYISTLAVSGSYLTNAESLNRKFSENDFDIGQNYKDNVYVHSKFEAEKLVYLAAREGLNATVLRMGNLTGRYDDGHFQKNISDNSFYSIIKSIYQLSVIPDDQLDLDIEFTPVDYASRASILLMQNSYPKNSVYHVTNHLEVSLQKLISIFYDLGIKIHAIPRTDFEQVVRSIAMDRENSSTLSGIILDLTGNNQFNFKQYLNIDSDITRKCLEGLGFKWPAITVEYMRKVFNYMIVSGFLNTASKF